MAPVVNRSQRGAIPVTIYSIGGTHVKEKKDAAALEAFFSLVFLLFSLWSLSVICAFPFAYKRGSRTPHDRHEHTVDELNKTPLHSIFSPKTWKLFPLSPVYNPYYKLVPVTQAAAD